MHMETMSAVVGIAFPSSAITRSNESMREPAWNHSTLAMNKPPMAAPKQRLSAYTEQPPSRNSSVEPEAENSGFNPAIRSTTGSCQRREPTHRLHPTVRAPYRNAPASDSRMSTGCRQNIVMPRVRTR